MEVDDQIQCKFPRISNGAKLGRARMEEEEEEGGKKRGNGGGVELGGGVGRFYGWPAHLCVDNKPNPSSSSPTMALATSAAVFSGFSTRPKTSPSLPGKTATLPPTRLNATKGPSSVCQPLPPDRPIWFPGSSPPEWLDGSLPGDFGFDPLGLGSDPELLKWFAQAELMHARWAMLAVAGILIPEWLEGLGFIENFSWYDAGEREYFADPTTLLVMQLALMGWAEGRRWADMLNPGCVDIEPTFLHKTKPKPDVGYPGGLWFDPLMWGRGSPEPVMVLRTKEIKNGRLAMLAFVGFCFQAIYTGQGPIDNLMAHLADPGHCNIFSAFTTHS